MVFRNLLQERGIFQHRRGPGGRRCARDVDPGRRGRACDDDIGRLRAWKIVSSASSRPGRAPRVHSRVCKSRDLRDGVTVGGGGGRRLTL